MTNYAKGANFERLLGKRLEKQGYFVVRSAGSHSAVDLVAIREYTVRLIQVKSSRRRLVGADAVEAAFGKDIRKLRELKCPTCVETELWLWTFRKGWRKFFVLHDRINEVKIA